jgi:hypothetical protein
MGLSRNGGIPAQPMNPSRAARPAAPALAVAVILMLVSFQYLTGCAAIDSTLQPVRYTGDRLKDDQAQLAAAAPRDRVLWEYRVAAEALRRGQDDEAKLRLDDALATLNGVLSGPDANAAKARGYFTGEAAKTFVGEPYERVMAYYYRGILYWRGGEPDNARACFRSAALNDADLVGRQYVSDYVLLDYLDGLVTTRLGGDGMDAFARAKTSSKLPLPAYDAAANVLCFVEYGHGPIKFAAGEYGEQLRFDTRPSYTHSAMLSVEGQRVALPPYDDLSYQAITRGGRVMDYILQNKAVFKETADAVGTLALTGAIIAHDQGSKQDRAAAIMATAGLISKIFSAATNAQADTRTWDNLPQYLSFAALRLAPGPHAARLEFFDANGRRLPEFTKSVTINVADAGADTVVFLSQLAE